MCDLVTSTDIDECELRIHTCDSNANCTDTHGSYNCACIDGFEGDGFNCAGSVLIIVLHAVILNNYVQI